MSVYADLHVHTNASDGTMALSDVPEAAKEADVSVVAITDHDRVHPELDAPIQEVDGVTLIRGVELRAQPADLDNRVDLLGYGVRETDGLDAELDRVRRKRAERGQAMVEMVEDRLNISLDIDAGDNIGRPHVARGIDRHPNTDHTYQDAFDELIGKDCPCYVPRYVTSFEDAAELLREGCHLVALAHPFRYEDPEAALELTAELDAVERFYPYGGRGLPDPEPADRVIDQHGLFPTGGSDAHGRRVGQRGLTEEQYRDFLTVAGLQKP